MNKNDLIKKLEELKIKPTQYSLNGDLLPDRVVLCNSYNDWIVFYLDERGKRRDEKIFHSEKEACEYIYKDFKDLKRFDN